jgi:hypothetical protein
MAHNRGRHRCQGCGTFFEADASLRAHQRQPRGSCHRFHYGHPDELQRLIAAGEALARHDAEQPEDFDLDDNVSIGRGRMFEDSDGPVDLLVGLGGESAKKPSLPESEYLYSALGVDGGNYSGGGLNLDQRFNEDHFDGFGEDGLHFIEHEEDSNHNNEGDESDGRRHWTVIHHPNPSPTFGPGATILDRFNNNSDSVRRLEQPYYPFRDFSEWQFVSALDRSNLSLTKMDWILGSDLVRLI